MKVSVEDAKQLLQELSAPARLVRHVELVSEAAEELLVLAATLQLPIERDRVRVGVLLHDIGKIRRPEELDEGGSLHEPVGESLLLARGWPPDVARICRLHADWQNPQCTLEELIVALADKLWKGKRVAELEELFLNRVETFLQGDRWELFLRLDACFESVASGGDLRLQHSRLP